MYRKKKRHPRPAAGRRKTPATTLSRTAWRLVFAYEEDLQKVLRGRNGVMAYRLRALGAYFEWLIEIDVDLPQVRPEDLHAFRLTLRGSARDCARRFDEVRRLYRFLYCRGLMRHDPGAMMQPAGLGARVRR